MSQIPVPSFANTPNCEATHPVKETALVVEGGGQRGIFTAGVLDSWLAKDFNPFSILIGTSAGAQNLSTYMTRQSGYAKRSIMQLSRDPEFFSIKRSFTKRNAMDLDWYFDRVSEPEYQLNMQCAENQLVNRQLLFSATNMNGFCPTFLEPTADNWLTMLKASSALPYLYKKGVAIGTDHYVDGGVALPIPIQEAYNRGAKKIIVLRTAPTDRNVGYPWARKLKSWVCKSNKCPKVLDIITGYEDAYNQAISFIQQPPEDAQVIEISPPTKLASRILGSSDKALMADYQLGVEVGQAFLQSQSAQLFKMH